MVPGAIILLQQGLGLPAIRAERQLFDGSFVLMLHVVAGGRRRWVELEKVGEVMEEMRRLGREKYVVEMGIGSAGTK